MPMIIPPPAELLELSRELEYQRKNTKAFIDADPIEVNLIERIRTATGAGGWKFTGEVPRNPQIMRLLPQSDIMGQVQTPDGIQLTPGYVLLGEHSALMQRWDVFELNTIKFMVVSPVRPDVRLYTNAYERKADVARY